MEKISYKSKEDFKYIINRDDADENKIKEMSNFATLPYNSSLLKFQNNLHVTLENLGYHVEKEVVDAKPGSYSDQVQDLNLQFFGRKRDDIQGKIGLSRSLKPFLIIIIGLILLSFGMMFKSYGLDLLSLIFMGIGIFIYFKAPKILTYTYTPVELGIWIIGKGHAIHGTKRHETKEGSEDRSYAKRYMESAYIQAEANLKIGANYEKKDKFYTERILSNKDKHDAGLIDLIKGIFKNEDKISFQDESKYKKLAKEDKDIEKHLSNDFKELKESLKKFS